jgi:4-diphosphocytidyl-2-C-methyl-D-erythritol kinase
MILFSPAKINLGLHILERRKDGFHNLQSVMYPIALCDIIEIHQLPEDDIPVRFTQSGMKVETDPENNLCIKAWRLLSSEKALPNVAIHLHKQIPVGAGLGGGSSNASAILRGLNLLARSPASPERVAEIAAQLGSDCPFFLHDAPMLMESRGEKLSQVNISLRNFHLALLFPDINISTAEAYESVTPAFPKQNLRQVIHSPLNSWKELLINDFEKSIFQKYPVLQDIKSALYGAGATYASMSGSGSSLFGIFETPPGLPEDIKRYVIWKGMA